MILLTWCNAWRSLIKRKTQVGNTRPAFKQEPPCVYQMYYNIKSLKLQEILHKNPYHNDRFTTRASEEGYSPTES